MSKGFFPQSQAASIKPSTGIAKCGACKLHKTCHTPRMKPMGKGRKNILIISDAPTELEDRKGVSFVGREGEFLKKHLTRLGVDLKRDCIRTHAVTCHPKHDFTDINIDACQSHIIKTIKKHNPILIILLGDTAIKSLMSWVWKDSVGGPGRWMGFLMPNQKLNTWIMSTYHPKKVLYKKDPLLEKAFKAHLKTAIKKVGTRPWKKLPKYEGDVEIITNPSKAARAIEVLGRQASCLAFDYECNCLKPEYNKAALISASICFDNKDTIAFPFTKSVREPFIKLLRRPVCKIACNIKFEDRWTRYHLKTGVRNWYWDTMIAAHVLDNRKEITSLKFQSAVLLGMDCYDGHIEPFLKSDKSKLNRINEIDMRDLLLYNGLDSLLTFKVALKQIKLLNKMKG